MKIEIYRKEPKELLCEASVAYDDYSLGALHQTLVHLFEKMELTNLAGLIVRIDGSEV